MGSLVKMSQDIGWSSRLYPDLSKESVVGEGLSPGREDKKRGSVRGTSKYGRIKYKIQFEERSGTLEVCVKGCEDLKAMNMDGTSDPYVVVTMIPGIAHSLLKTKVLKKNLNPEFNETFLTSVSSHVLKMMFVYLSFQISDQCKTLYKQVCFEVFDWERIIKDRKIGKFVFNVPKLSKDWVVEDVADLVFAI